MGDSSVSPLQVSSVISVGGDPGLSLISPADQLRQYIERVNFKTLLGAAFRASLGGDQ